MRRLPIQYLTAVALVSAASFIGVSASPASAAVRPHPSGHASSRPDFAAHGFGSGATSAAAATAARDDLIGNYSGCTGFILVSDTQGSKGVWSAEESANCTGTR